MGKRFIVYGFFFCTFLFSTVVRSQSSVVVAQIDTLHHITINDIQRYVYEYHFHRLYKPLTEGYRAALDQLLAKRLKVIDFFHRHLEKDSLLMSSIRFTLTEELINEYYKTQYYEKYVNDSALKRLYLTTGREVFYQQILLSKDDSMSKERVDSLRAIAYAIKQYAMKGTDFETLLKEYDQSTKKATVLTIDFDKSQSDLLSQIIFHLPTNTVEVLEDENSLIIVKVLSVQEKPLQPFDELREKLIRTLELHFVPRALAEFEVEYKRLVDEGSIRWNQKGLLKVQLWYQQSENDLVYINTIRRALQRGRDFVLMESPRGKIDLKRYLYYLEHIKPLRKKDSIQVTEIQDYLVEAFRKDNIVQKAKKLGLENCLLNAFTSNFVLLDEIARKYDEAVIEARIPHPTERDLKYFYEERKDSTYFQRARVNIYVAFAADTGAIVEFKKRLSLGVPFEKVDNRVFVKRFIRERDGTIRSENQKEPVELGVLAFQLSLNEVVGPIEYRDSSRGALYALVKCVYKEDEKQLTYDEVKNKVREDYKEFYRRRLHEENLNELKKLYKVTLYGDRFNQVLKSIGGVSAQ